MNGVSRRINTHIYIYTYALHIRDLLVLGQAGSQLLRRVKAATQD